MSSPDSYNLPDDVRLIDDHHLGQSQVVGTYLLLGDAPVLIDPGPTSTLTMLKAGLATHGLTLADIHALVLTHIHLDHAGAAGTIVARHPHLRVYVHQRGAPHLIAPDRLLSSAVRLYGDAMEYLWGEFRAVPESNVIALSGGETLRLGGRTLQVFDTPGHASHHLAYLDPSTGTAFVGDVAGVQVPGSPQARPPTPPPDIDLEAWNRSLDTLLAVAPQRLCLTHFGPVEDPPAHIADLRGRLRRWAETVRESLAQGEDESLGIAKLKAVADAELGDARTSAIAARYQQATPMDANWHGLARYWRKRGFNHPKDN